MEILEKVLADATNEDLIKICIISMSMLILRHSSMVAREQYNPTRDPDTSDAYIEEHKNWVNQFRKIREQVENLVTGLL